MKLLLLCDKPKAGKNANTLIEHIESFTKYSKFEVTELNPMKQNISSLDSFSIIVIHYSLVASSSRYLPPVIRRKIQAANAIKVMFVQDEYRFVNRTIATINALCIDVLFTCVPEQEIEKVYSNEELPGVNKINTLTGFVSDELTKAQSLSYSDKNIDVSYRSREIPSWLGRLGREKFYIANEFPKHVASYNLNLDINCSEQGRIYGENWNNLLSQSKAALGTESGASVFDFTGEIQRNVEQYNLKHPNAKFEEMEDMFFKDLEGKITLNQISPRCFEYAAYNVLMILFKGDYSGILKPWQHYIPLEKDFSNIRDVIAAIKDEQVWMEITTRAKEDIILKNKYSYKSFINSFDEVIVNEDKYQKLKESTCSFKCKENTYKINNKKFPTLLTTMRIKRTIYNILPKFIADRARVIYCKAVNLTTPNYSNIKSLPFRRLSKISSFANISILNNIYHDQGNEVIFCTKQSKACASLTQRVIKNEVKATTQIKLCNICRNYII